MRAPANTHPATSVSPADHHTRQRGFPEDPPPAPRRQRHRSKVVQHTIALVTLVLLGEALIGEGGLVAMRRARIGAVLCFGLMTGTASAQGTVGPSLADAKKALAETHDVSSTSAHLYSPLVAAGRSLVWRRTVSRSYFGVLFRQLLIARG